MLYGIHKCVLHNRKPYGNRVSGHCLVGAVEIALLVGGIVKLECQNNANLGQ